MIKYTPFVMVVWSRNERCSSGAESSSTTALVTFDLSLAGISRRVYLKCQERENVEYYRDDCDRLPHSTFLFVVLKRVNKIEEFLCDSLIRINQTVPHVGLQMMRRQGSAKRRNPFLFSLINIF